MLLQPPAKQDFDFQDDIRVDTENRGFTQQEIQKLAGPPPAEFVAKGEKGLGDWWNMVWGLNRPPEIQNLKSEFGYQSNPFLADLVSVADAQGTPLEGIIRARLPRYKFYLMRCGVYIAPEAGERFEALKFEVHYKDTSASTYAMLPGPQTDKILDLGGKADIGFSGKGEFGFPEIPLQGATISASAKAELEAKFIVSFHYELKTQVVDAFGTGTGFCSWLMYKGDQLRNDVVFYPVIMTPESLTEFECEFSAYFKINHSDWKNAEFFLKPPLTILVSA
jgi:hypothetical protein